MKLNLFNSFKGRTIVIFSFINVLLLMVLARFSYLFVRNLYLEQFREQLQTSLRVVTHTLDRDLLNYLTPAPNSMAQHYVNKALQQADSILNLSNVFVFDDQWQVLSALNRSEAITGLLVNKESLRHLKIGEIHIGQPFLADDGSWYLWAFQRLSAHRFIGLRENARRLAQIDRLASKFLWFGLGGVLLTLLAALFIAQSVHAPLKGIIQFSQKIGQGNFSVRPPHSKLKEIVELTQALNQMRQALAQRDQEKEQLLAQIAHELRNPLGGMELLIGLVRDDLPKDHPDQVYLDKVLQEIAQLKKQITEFLNYSRPRPAEPTNVNLPELAQELRTQFAHELQAKNTELLTNFEQSNFFFDREHLKHILSNLIANSLQAVNGQAGVIWLRCAHNVLEVEDNGPGIAAEQQDKIFQPFFTTKNDGVGLGLTICQKLCTLNQATLHFVPTTGGALFKIQLKTETIEQ